MPRGPRVDFPGAFHHVCARGIEQSEIVKDDRDREELRRRIHFNLGRTHALLLAWAFLPNHFHLLFYSAEGVLSRYMHRLMSGYSLYFNRRHKRVGHLFQNRFRSSLIETESYLREAIRYIHLNPLRAGLVASLDELARYPWTMHREVLQSQGSPRTEFPSFRDVFGGDGRETTLSCYLGFLEDGVRTDVRVAISDDLVRDETAPPPEWGMAPVAAAPESHRTFLRAVSHVCRETGIPVEHVLAGRKDRTSSAVRTEILQICVTGMGMDRRQICSWLGITDAGGAYLLSTALERRARLTFAGRTGNDSFSGVTMYPSASHTERTALAPPAQAKAGGEKF